MPMIKPKVVMLQGLPGSGKSTWASQQAGFVVVNKDAIRADFKRADPNWSWSHENEKAVIQIRDLQIEEALHQGRSVIVDDTNFAHKHKVRIEQLAREGGATFEVRKFDTPVETCIERDAQRTGDQRVGPDVIRQMAAQFHIGAPQPQFDPYEHDEHLMKAIICDLDGTLALFGDKRSPYDHSKCVNDDINSPIKRLIEIYYRFMGYQIIYLTGREEKFRPETNAFLMKHLCPPGPLWMRTTGDFRKDWIIKGELFDANIRNKYDVEFCLDDRNQVVEFWRSIGLTCLQVAEGNF